MKIYSLRNNVFPLKSKPEVESFFPQILLSKNLIVKFFFNIWKNQFFRKRTERVRLQPLTWILGPTNSMYFFFFSSVCVFDRLSWAAFYVHFLAGNLATNEEKKKSKIFSNKLWLKTLLFGWYFASSFLLFHAIIQIYIWGCCLSVFVCTCTCIGCCV